MSTQVKGYTVTLEKPDEFRIYSESFDWSDYDTPSDMGIAVAQYCADSVDLGWDVECFDDTGKIVLSIRGN